MPTNPRTYPACRAAVACLALLSTCIASASRAEAPAAADAPGTARQILAAAGVKGGLIVHLGCGDGKLTAALGANGRYLVHGLAANAADVERARAHVRALGLDAKVLVERLAGKRLPYTDNLVNLVVAERLGEVPMAEVMRVLCPGGVAYVVGSHAVRRSGEDALTGTLRTKTVKPRPAGIDEWTHYLHGADGNAVAHDLVVGPPRRVQWLAGPMYARHHDTLASVSAMVSTGGRVFYIIDEGQVSLLHLPPKWRLVARDAFNGVRLWKKAIGPWVNHLRGFRSGPPQLPRRLVAVGERVFVTLGLSAPVTALDAASGAVLKTYDRTAGTDEIVVHKGVLLAVVLDPKAAVDGGRAPRRGLPAAGGARSVVALDAETGAILWRKSGRQTAGLHPMTLAAAGERVCFQRGRSVFCVSLKTGAELWSRQIQQPAGQPAKKPPRKPSKAPRKRPRKPRKPRSPTRASHYAPTLVLCEKAGVVLAAYGSKLTALSLDRGEALWTCPCKPDFRAPADVFLADGLVWAGLFCTQGRDPGTGEVKRTIDISGVLTAGHHPRCHRNKATDRYIIVSKRGMEFFDIRSGKHSRNNWARGGCQYGILPCNGLIYLPPNACCCYQGVLLHGLYAVAAERKSAASAARDEERLEKGPAYGKATGGKGEVAPGDWPTFRADIFRSGAAKTKGPAEPVKLWETEVGGKLRPPVVAAGKVLVASENEGLVTCLDSAGGKRLWTFQASGRVDSPPTVYEGRVLFGSGDGHVYCLTLADGRLVYRFRAAPELRYCVVDDRLESVWPARGSVLVKDGVAYCVAGRSCYLDGGISLYGLDPATGKRLYAARYFVPHEKDRASAFAQRGSLSDVLSSDGKWIYMKHVRFNRELVRQEGLGRHLYADSGLTDDNWFYRTFWKLGYGDLEPPIRLPWSYRKHHITVPFGQLLVFDDAFAWGLQTRFPSRISGYRDGYADLRLVRAANRPFDPDEKPGSDVSDARGWREPTKYDCQTPLPFQARAMVLTDRKLFVAGWPDVADPKDPYAAVEGRKGGLLWVFSVPDGKKLAERKLDCPAVFDGLIAANGRLYMSTRAGRVVCLGSR